jgi:trimeric autotransporter adhesin
VQLGATKSEGLPLDLFVSGEARWLGVRVNSGEEQPRVLLLSVPYALKAADAETLSGLPASAFMLAAAAATAKASAGTPMAVEAAASPALSGTGKLDYVPLWTSAAGALGNSILFQSGSGTTGKIGVNTTAPAATLDVNGAENVHGILNLMTTGAATATAGKNSQPLDFTASSYNSSTAAAVAQKFQWQAEAVGNNTASASSALSLLYGSGTTALAETGLKIQKSGVITFASGQTFPGTGPGTVTSVALSAPASDFTVSGTPVKGTGTLGLAWTVAPTSNATANAIVKRDGTGSFNAGAISASLGVSGYASAIGVYGQSNGAVAGDNGVQGVTDAGPASGVAGFNYGSNGGIGVYGNGGNGSAATGVFGTGNTGVYGTGTAYGFATDSNVQQARTAGGWVKAMAYVQGATAPYSITRCFNSTLAGAAATTPPCGFNFVEDMPGYFFLDFGFRIDDRFMLATPDGTEQPCTMETGASGIGDTIAYVLCNPAGGGNWVPFEGTVFVF